MLERRDSDPLEEDGMIVDGIDIIRDYGAGRILLDSASLNAVKYPLPADTKVPEHTEINLLAVLSTRGNIASPARLANLA